MTKRSMRRCARARLRAGLSGLALLLVGGGAAAADAPTAPGADYAESVAIGGMSSDGAIEFSLRLARYPARNSGSVWLQLALDGQAWSLVEDDLRLRGESAPGRAAEAAAASVTPVAADSAEFRASGRADVRFHSSVRHSSGMRGDVLATLYAHATRDPEPGPGDVPVRLELSFAADGPGGRLNEDSRWELFGRIYGRILLGGKVYEIELPGGWHEQVGDRPTFAPPFTYLKLQGEDLGLLAIDYSGRAAGFAEQAGKLLSVRRFVIKPAGEPVRTFEVELEDGSLVTGSARTVQTWTMPIEGRRRPGSGVLVESNRGALAGSLNDWDPGPAP